MPPPPPPTYLMYAPLIKMVENRVGPDFVFHAIFPKHYTFLENFHPGFIKTFDQYPSKFNFDHFSALQWNCSKGFKP